MILDANERVGDSWRKRWPSLRLYSPARYDGLPGMPFPAPRNSFPTRHEMADYLEAYAARFALPVRSGVAVDGLCREGRARYVVTAGRRRFEADNVVVATGVMQMPLIPDFAADLDPRITQLHSSDYRSPAQLQDGRGPRRRRRPLRRRHRLRGRACRAPHDAVGQGHGSAPVRRRGPTGALRVFPLMRFLAHACPDCRHADRPQDAAGDPLARRPARCGSSGRPRGRRRRARPRPTVGVEDGQPVLEDGRVLDVANVIWCTGFRNDYSLDPTSRSRRRRRLPGAVARRRPVGARPLLRRDALPALLHLDAHPRRRPGRRARREAHRGTGQRPRDGSGRARHSSARGRAGHVVKRGASSERPGRGWEDAILVWNGMVSRTRWSPSKVPGPRNHGPAEALAKDPKAKRAPEGLGERGA